jgi:hypothetical protein
MMPFLLHCASILLILMKSNGQLLNIDKCKWLYFYNFKVTLDLLMGPSSKFVSLRTLLCIEANLMG